MTFQSWERYYAIQTLGYKQCTIMYNHGWEEIGMFILWLLDMMILYAIKNGDIWVNLFPDIDLNVVHAEYEPFRVSFGFSTSERQWKFVREYFK